MKKWVSISISLIVILMLVACGSTQEASKPADNSSSSSSSSSSNNTSSEEKFPNKEITIIVSYAAGGGTDVGARILVPYLEKELGVPVNILNKPGGGGWIGWTELAEANPDGYTIGYINTPNLMTGYLDPQYNRKHNLESFAPIANHVSDPGAIAIRVDETRFTDIASLMEYAKNNKLTATSTGVGSDDHYASLKLNHKFGTQFEAVHNKGSAESRTSVLGGHVDVLFANVGELTQMHKEGQIKIVAVMSQNRSPFLEDVPTMKESGFEVFSGSARGLAAPKGVDAEKLEILRKALENAITNEEQIKKMGEMGLEVDYQSGDDYIQLLKNDEQGVLDLRGLLGW